MNPETDKPDGVIHNVDMSHPDRGVRAGRELQPHAAQLLHEVEVLEAELVLVVREGDVAAPHRHPDRPRDGALPASANIC